MLDHSGHKTHLHLQNPSVFVFLDSLNYNGRLHWYQWRVVWITYCYGIILSEYMFNASMESMILYLMVYAKVQCIDVNPRCQSTSMMRGIGCGDMWPRERFRMQRVVSFNFFKRLICECISRSRTMEVALVICCAYEWDWNYMRWMAVDVDLDHKNDDSHVIGCWSVVVWRAMMYTGGDRDWTAPWGELESFFLGILWRGLANQNSCCYVSTNERRYYGATTGQ